MLRLDSHRLARTFVRFPALWLLLVAVSVVPSVILSSRLRVDSDFKNLLPQDKPSVVELNRMLEAVGGTGTLIVAVESDDHRAIERFFEDLAVGLKPLSPEYIRYVEYNVSDVKRFFEKNKYLYVELGDLKQIHDRLAKKIRYEKLRQNPFFIALEEDRVEFDLGDIEDKYRTKTSRYDEYTDGYFFGKKNKLAAFVIRPRGTATGTKFARELIDRVQHVIDRLNPQSYHPSMSVTFVGKYRENLDEYAQLFRDVFETLALTLILVAIALYLYFLRFRVIWLLTVALGVGSAWTFALTQLQIGYLNSQTVFLGSIIVGNSVNYGIILLARFLEERRQGHSVEPALATAIRTTWHGTLASALTTSAGFAVLAVSQIKGFNHFGFIGGLGMTLCWLATYIVVPPLLVLSERVLPIVRGNFMVSKQWEFLLAPVSSLVAYSPRIIAAFGLFLVLASTFFVSTFLPDSLEYDFSKLRNKPNPVVGTRVRDDVDKILGGTASPSVMLLDRESQAPYICAAVMARESMLPEQEKTLDNCKTIYSYLPEDQDEKLKVLARIRKLMDDSSLNFVKKEYRKEIDEFRSSVNLKKVGPTNLPATLQRTFMELDGRTGRLVYIYGRSDARLSNGKRLIAFVDRLSNVRLPDGSVARISGESPIFADLLKTVTHEGPLTSVYSFLAVALIVLLTFRRMAPSAYVIGGLLVGVIYMFGVQSVLHIKLNFFNFIAIPVTFGIGVDYGVNLLQRYHFEGRGSVRRVLRTVGGAIVLCSMTTTISYVTLLTAQNQALVSFGWLGLIGELACLFAAIVVMPALLHSFDRGSSEAIIHSIAEKTKQSER